MPQKNRAKKQKVNKILKIFFGEFEYFGGSDVANKLHVVKGQKISVAIFLGSNFLFSAHKSCRKFLGGERYSRVPNKQTGRLLEN